MGLRVARITTAGKSITQSSSTKRNDIIREALLWMQDNDRIATTDSIHAYVVQHHGIYLSRFEINEVL